MASKKNQTPIIKSSKVKLFNAETAIANAQALIERGSPISNSKETKNG